ncbi:hypothetical protein [Mammaliicoccus sciuri]|uniref:hypothetical protein n=1 Tax=Mammaliicoccus sciuri TaxID=1296 RepID=UPI003F54B9D9
MDFIIKHMIKIRVLLIVIFLFLTLAIVEAEKILLYYVVIAISGMSTVNWTIFMWYLICNSLVFDSSANHEFYDG